MPTHTSLLWVTASGSRSQTSARQHTHTHTLVLWAACFQCAILVITCLGSLCDVDDDCMWTSLGSIVGFRGSCTTMAHDTR